MQSFRVGKIEEETHLTDLDQLEKEMEQEIEDEVNAKENAPHTSAHNNNQPLHAARMGQSKFTQYPKARSSFFPGQSAELQGKALGVSQPLVAESYADKLSRSRRPANDSQLQSNTLSKFAAMNSSASPAAKKGALRMTVDALMSLGALPLQMLSEIGHFRYAKERKFNSLLRLERSLGQGYEDAEQFLRTNPRALRKKSRLRPPILENHS